MARSPRRIQRGRFRRKPVAGTVGCVLAACWLTVTGAAALPTPDVVAGAINLVPLLFGALAALAAGMLKKMRALLGEGAGTLVVGMGAGAALPCLVLVGLAASSAHHRDRQDRIRDVGVYLRCDLGVHEWRERWKADDANRRLWQQIANVQEVTVAEAGRRLMNRPDAMLAATYRTRIEYESGIPALRVGAGLKPFDFVRGAELPSRLRAARGGDLYLAGFEPFYRRDPRAFGDAAVFARFDNVYVVTDVTPADRYVRLPGGGLRPADAAVEQIDWPVEDEWFVLDEPRVDFPGFATLLSDARAARLLERQDVQLIVPLDSLVRNEPAYLGDGYLQKLLFDVDPARVHSIDVNGPEVTAGLEALAAKLDGRRFMVAGLTKYDYYHGNDVAFELWERLGSDPERFRFEGTTARLPEVAASLWVADKTTGPIASLHRPFWGAVRRLRAAAGLSMGLALFVLAMVTRLVVLPITVLEGRSRIQRRWLEDRRGIALPPAWSAARAAVHRHLGVRAGWEILGGAVTLALVLPVFRIIAGPQSPIAGIGFLWIEDLGRPDVLAAVVAGGLLVVRQALAAAPGKRLRSALYGVGFSMLLFLVPAAVLVWFAGVLVVTIVQDLLLDTIARGQRGRLLLLKASFA